MNKIIDLSNYGQAIKDYIVRHEDRPMLGELGHPNNNTINLVNVSHQLHLVYDKDALFEVQTLDTQPGKILAVLINQVEFEPLIVDGEIISINAVPRK